VARSTAAEEAAWPTQVVATGGRMNCMVSYTASIAVTDPPGELR
jgi:hypothetical protein